MQSRIKARGAIMMMVAALLAPVSWQPARAQEAMAARLTGGSWLRLLELQGQGDAGDQPQDIAQTLVFKNGGVVSGSTGCNGFGGKVTLDQGRFRMGPTRVTLRGCLPPVMAAERDFMQRLGAARQWWLRGDELYLADGTGLVLLRFARR